MEPQKVRKLALCNATTVVLRPNTPYIFEATPGCVKCAVLVKEANDEFGRHGESFDFTDPKTSPIPLIARPMKLDDDSKKTKGKKKH